MPSHPPEPAPDGPVLRRNLPKLPRQSYQGLAVVHWVFTMRERRTGWLNDVFSLRFQMAGIHACLRYRVAAPCYCLMPDHIHLLLMGYDGNQSDQSLAVAFWRKQLKTNLAAAGFEFQAQAYDHVLRDTERGRESFEALAGYIRQNPWRAGLVEEPDHPWPYEGAVVPGYPDLKVRDEDFWERYWRIFYGKLLVEAES